MADEASGWGPFETQRDAAEHPAVSKIHQARRNWTGPVTEQIRQADAATIAALILGACDESGVTLGAYDRRIIGWLSNFEPETCAVIAGLIRRAVAKEDPDGT